MLFPDAQEGSNDTLTHTDSTERTPRTAGLSRLSDFGSLDTAAQSRQTEGVPYAATDGYVEEDDELDTLDEGLHAFQEPSAEQESGYFDQSNSILPRHDGLGAFPASSVPVQEQLWHFEQYNPRKRSVGHRRRGSSVQKRLDALEDKDAGCLEGERRERIEKWRTEQSRLLLDEIEKETRRRRTSFASHRAERTPSTAGLEQTVKQSINVNAGEDDVDTSAVRGEGSDTEGNDSYWQRITRRIIRDFIGIDDAMLSVLFGESLPPERPASNSSDGCSTSRSPYRSDPVHVPASTGWETRLLDRLARELGFLVHQLSDHPGAFSTPFNPITSDYAGIPVTVPTSSKSQPKPSSPLANPTTITSPSFTFAPTLHNAAPQTPAATADSTHAALWGIEEEPSSCAQEGDKEYWEQTPDIKTVFRFIRNRFTSSRRPSTVPKPPLNIATSSTPDSLRRAAIIRQYHPLVSRAAAAWEQRHGYPRRQSLLRSRNGSSCASSMVGSVRRGPGQRGGSLGSSSRNYWDLGGSAVGSGGGGSAIGIGGGIGAWGEI